MTSIWIPVTILAAAVQTLRNGLFKHAKKTVSDDAILFVRFAFALIFAIALMLVIYGSGYKMPTPNGKFAIYVFGAAIIQVIGGFLFLALFSRRNFVIGVTYGKTEALQAAIFSALLFGDFISVGALFAILLGLAGILLISIIEQHISANLLAKIFTKSAQIGLACGACFGLAGVLIREAILALGDDGFFIRSTYTMTCIFAVQAITMLFVMYMSGGKERFRQILLIKRDSVLIGATTMTCALCWFVAFSFAKAAHVALVGQIEILFSVFMTHKIFKENINKLEIVGMGMLVASIVIMGYVK